MTLEEFLDEPSNMHAREAILMHRLFFDMQLSAARSGYYLNTYFDDVDHDGFDVIFDDKDVLKKVQVKSLRRGASTNSWYIHKRILRPMPHFIDKYGFDSSAVGEGVHGGVILIEYAGTSTSLDVSYLYTDLDVLMAFECEILSRGHKAKKDAVDTCLGSLLVGLGSESIRVPRAAFLTAKDVASLLALVGLHGPINSVWSNEVLRVVNHTRPFADRTFDLSMPIDRAKRHASDEIKKLISDVDVCV